MQLQNYVCGQWVAGDGAGHPLIDPVNGAEIARASGKGLDLPAALDFARRVGNPALQVLTFEQRAGLLHSIADVLGDNREEYYRIAALNSGNTKVDAAFDIDGGIGTLKFYAGLGKRLGPARLLIENGFERLGKDEAFQAAHIRTPLTGCAVHINAFNFPSWGLWEKAAVALLSGLPVVAKPATLTALLSYQMVRDVVAADILPEGALSLICADGHMLVEALRPGDAMAFTGSAETAAKLRASPAVAGESVRFNAEADSLNAAVLGPDATPDTDEFQAFVREVVNEMVHKAGQKCTAIRRAFVPSALIENVQSALFEQLTDVVVGDPRSDGVTMGPLVNQDQVASAWKGIEDLHREAYIVFGGDEDYQVVDGDPAIGAFFPPTLLRCDKPNDANAVHEVEVFGPVSTLMPYRDVADVCELATAGRGSLVTSVFSSDDSFALEVGRTLAPWHGRLALMDGRVVKSSPGHGTVMPQCTHGGPGRAGGGEELGGLRGLTFYTQRTAIQGHSERLEKLKASAAVWPE